jgi:hypothetical protein
MLDETRFRGKLLNDSNTVREQLNRVKAEVETKVLLQTDRHYNQNQIGSGLDHPLKHAQTAKCH